MTKDDRDKLEHLLTSPGWVEVLKPELEAHIELRKDSLMQVDRKSNVSDDYIRGQVNAFAWLLEGIAERIKEFDVNAAKEGVEQPEVVHSPYVRQPEDNPLGS